MVTTQVLTIPRRSPRGLSCGTLPVLLRARGKGTRLRPPAEQRYLSGYNKTDIVYIEKWLDSYVLLRNGGPEGTRTSDLLHVKETL